MGLFKKNPGAVPNRAASPARRPVQSADQWAESLKQRGAATPAGQAITAAADKADAARKRRTPGIKLSDAEQQLTPKQLGEVISSLVLRNQNYKDDSVIDKLDELRNSIDDVDEELIHVLKKRAQIIEEIGVYKKEHNITIFQLDRWQEILRTRAQLAQKLGLSPNHVEKICQLLHEESIRIQNGLMNK